MRDTEEYGKESQQNKRTRNRTNRKTWRLVIDKLDNPKKNRQQKCITCLLEGDRPDLRVTKIAGCGEVEVELRAPVAAGLLDHTLQGLYLGYLCMPPTPLSHHCHHLKQVYRPIKGITFETLLSNN